MAALFDHVTVCKALSVLRRHDRTPEQGDVNLPTMRMPGDEQAEPIREGRKDVGIVSEHQDRRVVVDLAHGLSDIMRTFPKIADPNQPKVRPSPLDSDGAVFQDPDLVFFQSSKDSSGVQPPVVIAQTRPDTHRRCQPRKNGRGVLWCYEGAAPDPMNDEISRDDDQVWFQTVRELDDLLEFRYPVEGRADMQIGEHGNT